jgi:hypothetical protein
MRVKYHVNYFCIWRMLQIGTCSMKQRSSPRTSKRTNANFDLHLLTSVYESIGLVHPDNWKKITPKEVALIKAALVRADKLRTAAWDPGAAYMSGVMDMIISLRPSSSSKLKKLSSGDE